MTKIAPHASPDATDSVPNAALATSTQASPFAQHRTGFIVAFFAAIFMTITAAVGTDIVPFGTRLVYWMIVMLTGATIGAGVTSGVQSWGRLRNHIWAEGVLVSFLIALPLTLAVVGAGMILLNMQRPSADGLVLNFGLVVLVSMAITSISYAIMWGQKGRETNTQIGLADSKMPPVPATPMTDQRFRDRLPLHLANAQLLALQSEDHYLRVHTADGETLILMRLTDAIAALAEVPGAQTHRSWWVARAAVIKSVRREGKAILTLTGEIEAPVSRNYMRALNDAGWFR